MDTLTVDERSQMMAAVRSRRNKSTELALVAIFRAHGITGWRRNQLLPGRPDFWFQRERVAIFVDGCYWHGCPSHGRVPKSNVDYWQNKIQKKKRRDSQVNRVLRNRGWQVLRVWEHALKNPKRVANRVRRILGRE